MSVQKPMMEQLKLVKMDGHTNPPIHYHSGLSLHSEKLQRLTGLLSNVYGKKRGIDQKDSR